MKLLIVDDEKHVRNAIKMLINPDELPFETILEASDGQEACDIVQKERPEIVLTDMMMPVKNGVQLLEWLKDRYPQCRSIVISGYKDYEFMRSTIKCGGIDYILKPIHPDQLQEAIRKAISSWEEEEQKRDQHRKKIIEIHRFKPLYRDKLFSDLLKEGRFNRAIAEEFKQELAPEGPPDNARVCVLSAQLTVKPVRDKFGDNLDLLGYAVTNICNEMWGALQRGYAFRNLHSEPEIVLLLWKSPDEVTRILSEINQLMKRILGGTFPIGVGSVKPFPSGMAESYTEAKTALKRKNMLRPHQWICDVTDISDYSVPAVSFAKYDEQLSFALRHNNAQMIRTVLDSWENEFRKMQHLSWEQLEWWWYELGVILSREVRHAVPEERMEWNVRRVPVPLDDQGSLDITAWMEEWRALIFKVAERFGANRKQQTDPIEAIAEYLKRNYNENLSLQHIADRFFLSREHISRKFKQKYGTNVFDYIGRIRIDKAKWLLLDPTLKIVQIARMVGYEDEKYFSKVFKKFEGISPNDYRKQAVKRKP